MFSSNVSRFAVLATAVAVIAVPAAAQSVPLRLDLPVDHSTDFKVTTVQVMNAELGKLGSQLGQTEHVLEYSRTVRADENENGAVSHDIVWNRFAETVRREQGETGFDTASDAPPSRRIDEQLYRTLIGRQLTSLTSARGDVTKVTGVSDAWGAFPMSSNDKRLELAINNAKQSISDETFASVLQLHSPQFPENPVSVGQSWSTELRFVSTLTGVMNLRATNTYEGIEVYEGADVRKITTVYEVVSETESPIMTQIRDVMRRQDVEIEPAKLHGAEGTGTFWIDAATGETHASEVEFSATSVLALPVEHDHGPDDSHDHDAPPERMTLFTRIQQTAERQPTN